MDGVDKTHGSPGVFSFVEASCDSESPKPGSKPPEGYMNHGSPTPIPEWIDPKRERTFDNESKTHNRGHSHTEQKQVLKSSN